MYIPLLLYETKCAQQLSYGFNILEVLEGCHNENQIPTNIRPIRVKRTQCALNSIFFDFSNPP